MKKASKLGLEIVVPFVAGVLMLGLNLLGFNVVEWRIYDVLLHIKPAITEDPRVTFLAVDDTTINNINMYPLSRDYMADGLVVLAEFGAAYTTFDVEFVDKSPRGVDARYLESDIPQQFNLSFSDLEQNISDVLRSLAEKRYPLSQAASLADALATDTAQRKDELLTRVQQVARDNDQYLGGAVRLFGNAVLTVNTLNQRDDNTADDLRKYAVDHFALKKVTLLSGRDPTPAAVDIRPAIAPVIQDARAAGFPRVDADPDGVVRRVSPMYRYQGAYIPQLGLAGLLDWFGNPAVEVYGNRIVLRGAKHPDRGETDITIPLASDGKILVNWPRKLFKDSFRQVSFYALVYYRQLEQDLAGNLQIMDQEGYLRLPGVESPLLNDYKAIAGLERDLLAGKADRSLLPDYRQARESFLADLGAFLLPEGDKALLGRPAVQAQIRDEYQRLLGSGTYSEEQQAAIRQKIDYAAKVFDATRSLHVAIVKARADLKASLEGKYVIIGYTGTSTTDIGANPFQGDYMKVGTHASLVNTVLSGAFLRDLPWWAALLLGLVLAVAVTLIVTRLEPLPSILVGTGVVLVVVVGIGVFFILTGVFVPVLTPTIVIFLTFLALSLMKFLRTAQEKSQIRNAFGHYLAADVIAQVLTDPEKLKLGGEKKYMTAMFTDVKGFSTISEKLDPQELVSLLNEYLTEMSDTIMNQKGTVDKYEGDAIIAFFGAPVSYEDHAERACYAACRMKSLEEELNKKFLADQRTPTPILTRIGINTGDMVVGNMGSERKFDYTMMGSNVNLAARLEGVNKQYGTWMLISEATYKEGGSKHVCRKLDRVRVVGINEPVRLYELVGNKKFVSDQKREVVERFQAALDVFEQKDWEAAQRVLQEILAIDPDDGPAGVYVKRCAEFLAKAPPASWDGVFNLTSK